MYWVKYYSKLLQKWTSKSFASAVDAKQFARETNGIIGGI